MNKMNDKTYKLLSIFAFIAFSSIAGGGGVSAQVVPNVTQASTTQTPQPQTTTSLPQPISDQPILKLTAPNEVNQTTSQTTTIKPPLGQNTTLIPNVTQTTKVPDEPKNPKGLIWNLNTKIQWLFKSPTDNDVIELDKYLNIFVPFGAANETDYLEAWNEMDWMCRFYDRNMDTFKSWLRRRYHSLLVQEEYVTNMRKLKEVNSKLVVAKNQFLDATNFLKNQTSKLPHIGRVCCAFWNYQKQLNSSGADPKAITWSISLINGYFSTTTEYLCIFYPVDSPTCAGEALKSPQSQHKYKSIIMEMVLTLSDVVAPNKWKND